MAPVVPWGEPTGRTVFRAQNTLCHLTGPVQVRSVALEALGPLNHFSNSGPPPAGSSKVTLLLPAFVSAPIPALPPGAVDEDGRMPFYAEECASMLAVTFSGGDKMLRSIVSAPACTPGPWPITLCPILCSAASSLADLRLGGHCWRAELRLGIIWEMVFISKILTYKLILCTVRGLLSVTLMTDFFEVPFFGRIWAWLLFVGLKNRPVVFQPLCKPCAFWCLLTPGHLCSQEPAVVVSLGRAGEGAGQDKESGPSFGPRESSSLGPQQTRAWSEREWSLELWEPLQGSGPSACAWLAQLHPRSSCQVSGPPPELPAALPPGREWRE